jgi:TolA-binding protein
MPPIKVFAFLLCALLTNGEIPNSLAQSDFKVTLKPSSEERDRKVDQAAIAANEQATLKLQTLLKRYQGHRQEPILLARLAQIYQQTAQIQFRVSHARKSNADLSSYRKWMSRSIDTLNLLITKYPKAENIELAYFMRGKAHEEIEDRKSATRDYLHLVQTYPESAESTSAHMSLAQFAIDQNEHERALSHLKQVEERPENAHYSFALFKMGWSYYNLKKIPIALSYIERHINWYRDHGKKSGLTQSDTAILENSLLDLALFYFDGFEKKQDGFTTQDAYSYFRKWESGATLGRMLLRYSKLLRAHDHESELVALKNLIVRDLPSLPEAFDIVIVAFDHQLNRRKYDALILTAKDMITLYKAHQSNVRELDSYARAQKLLLDTAKLFQSLTIKNKNSNQVTHLSTTLAGVYDTFTKIVESTDPRIPGVHYNLAETLFEIKQYAEATQHYLWVLKDIKTKSSKEIRSLGIDPKTASLKAIASRYEVLRLEKLIPNEVKATALVSADVAQVGHKIEEWVQWIDEHAETYAREEEFDQFEFEANRALYAGGQPSRAVVRLEKFAIENPKSKLAVPSASLVLDSWVATRDWEQTRKLALKFSAVPQWQSGTFGKRLFELAADASYQIMAVAEKDGKTDLLLRQAQDFIKVYSKSARIEDTLLLAANAALKLKNQDLAFRYFSELIEQFPHSENTASALKARASLAEERYNWSASLKDRLTLLTLPESQTKVSREERVKLRSRALYLEWLSHDAKRLEKAAQNPLLCLSPQEKDPLAEDCSRYKVLSALLKPLPDTPTDQELKKVFHQALHAEKGLRALWALQALRLDTHERALEFPDRLLLVRLLATGFDDQPAQIQFVLLPSLQKELTRAFEQNRLSAKKFAGLKATEKSIKHRVALIHEMEQAATRVAKLPYARLQASVLSEISKLYLDFSSSLQGLATPTGLSGSELGAYQDMIRKLALPFEEKGQTIGRKAFEIASDQAIERDSFERVSNSFFADNPSQSKALKQSVPFRESWELTLESALQLHKWSRTERHFLDAWKTAVHEKNLALSFHLLNEHIKEPAIDAQALRILKSITLVSAGAQAEGLAELERVRESLSPEAQAKAIVILISCFSHSLSQKKTKSLIAALERIAPDQRITKLIDHKDETALVALSAEWSGAEITSLNRKELLDHSKRSQQKDVAEWAKKSLDELEKARTLASESAKTDLR